MKLECSYVQLPKIYRHLSGNELKVFVTMFDQWSMMKNEDGWYYRSQKQLCEDTGLTDRTLRDIIKKFVEKGGIFTTTYNDGVKIATYNKANEYKINMKKVVEMSKEKVVKKVKEGGNFYHPSNNIITKENNKINNINIKTSEDIIPDDGTLQDDEGEYGFFNNSDDERLNYEVKRSMMGEVNNDLKLNDMKKENEMSNKAAIEMNAISEQSERQARENERSGCRKKNEMTTSTLGYKNNTSKEFQNIPVDKSKVTNEENDTPKGLTPHPQIALHPLSPSAWDEDAIFGAGEPKNVSDDKLSTNEEKTRQEAQKCPQNETDVFKRISEILEEALVITDVEPFKAKLQEAIDLLKQVRPSANINAFTRCCDDTIYWFKNNNFDDLDIFFAASDFKRNIEQMKRA